MSRKKTDYSNDVKKKVVLEVLKEEETLNQIASKYKIIPRNIQKWRRQVRSQHE